MEETNETTCFMIQKDIKKLLDKNAALITKEEANSIVEYLSIHHDKIKDDEWAAAVIKASSIIKTKYDDLSRVTDFMNNAIVEFDKTYPRSYGNLCDMIKQECLLLISSGKTSKAHERVIKYLSYAIGQIEKTATNESMDYYSFRKISDYSLKDIKEESICLAHPCEFNDPLDTLFLYWLDYSVRKLDTLPVDEQEFRLLLKKTTNHIKMRCMVAASVNDGKGGSRNLDAGDLPILMWSHYADSHKGFCVKYHFDHDFFSKINEEIRLIHEVEYIDKLKVSDALTIKEFLFQKDKSWKNEHEMRLLYYSPNNDNPYPTLQCKGAIKAVYLGVKCSDSDQRKMEQAIGDKEIPLYRMVIDQSNLTRFKSVRIG